MMAAAGPLINMYLKHMATALVENKSCNDVVIVTPRQSRNYIKAGFNGMVCLTELVAHFYS